jgi:hypothetical protein
MGDVLGPVAPVRPAWQDVLHWNAPAQWRDGPAWFDEHAHLYGFPDVDGLGIKAVTHEPGRRSTSTAPSASRPPRRSTRSGPTSPAGSRRSAPPRCCGRG